MRMLALLARVLDEAHAHILNGVQHIDLVDRVSAELLHLVQKTIGVEQPLRISISF